MSTTERAAVTGVTIASASDVAGDQAAWDKAVECLQHGLSDVQAIPLVYNKLTPPRTLDGVAAIIGAIYADNYWANVKMDPARLAAALAQTGLWDPSACLKAATLAFKTWRGLWVRANTAPPPLGAIPKSDPLMASPDVPSAGPQPLTRDALLLNWPKVWSVQAGVGKNYANARAQSVNLPVPITQARVRLFWAATSAGVPDPSQWIEMETDIPGDDVLQGFQPGPIQEGRKGATGSFVFSPPKAGHYCMTALASTEFFKNPLPTGGGNWSINEWLRSNGAAGWCNLDVTGTVRGRLLFFNHDDRPERFEFEVHCHGLAEGTVVTLNAAEPGVSASVTASGPVQVLRSGPVTVPANFTGELEVSARTPGDEPLPAGATVEVRTVWLVDEGHRHHADAVAVHGFARAAGEAARVEMGSFTYLGPER